MRLVKRVSVFLLTTCMIIGSIFAVNINNSYASTSYIKKLELNKTYKYDLDNDKDKDNLKIYISGDKLKLKVNNTTKILISNFYKDCFSYDVKLYDFNEKDSRVEIVCYYAVDSTWGTRILKFKNDTCKVNRLYEDAIIRSYNKNGIITFEEYDYGRYKEFAKAIGCFCCLGKVRVDGYNLYNQYTANTFGIVKDNKYVASKKLTAYKDKNNKVKKFIINKNDKVNIVSLYKKGNEKYIKVKNSSGNTGYVKVGSTMLFTKDSCVWAR